MGRLATLYRHPLTPAEFRVIADVWADDFRDVADNAFQRAVVEYRRRHQFFPAGTHVLLGICAEMRIRMLEEQRRNLAALPEVVSEEMRLNNIEQAQKLLAKLGAGARPVQ